MALIYNILRLKQVDALTSCQFMEHISNCLNVLDAPYDVDNNSKILVIFIYSRV